MQLRMLTGMRKLWCYGCQHQSWATKLRCICDTEWHQSATHGVDPPEHIAPATRKRPRAPSLLATHSYDVAPPAKATRKVRKYIVRVPQSAVVHSTHPALLQEVEHIAIDEAKCPKLAAKRARWRREGIGRMAKTGHINNMHSIRNDMMGDHMGEEHSQNGDEMKQGPKRESNQAMRIQHAEHSCSMQESCVAYASDEGLSPPPLRQLRANAFYRGGTPKYNARCTKLHSGPSGNNEQCY